jgi:isopentenyl diphosphate isomerase/L-lactate dehydrogenase-like FMN-dependent dehydrogenase
LIVTVSPISRRGFLTLGATGFAAAQLSAVDRVIAQGPPAITAPEHAVNVFDFEPLAQKAMRAPHWTYLDMGVEGEVTLRANRTAFEAVKFRTRRFVDVSRIDTTTEILDTALPSPIILAPIASQRAFHPEGEAAVARAAGRSGHHFMLSTLTTTTIEEVNSGLGQPAWFQLYPGADWKITRGLLDRAESAGCQVVALTVDLPASKRERQWRWNRRTNEACQGCHQADSRSRKRMYDGIDLTPDAVADRDSLTADFIKRLQDSTSMQVVIKGISTARDAAACLDMDVAGVVVSNHGGRAEESGRSTIESLPEVVQAIDGRIPVLIDSGFRRGTDIFKALAMGADGVMIGRPYIWGLGAFGEPGVARVLELLQEELEIVMRQAGTPSLNTIRAESVEVADRFG